MRAAVRKLFHNVVDFTVQIALQAVDVMHSRIGMTVDGSCFGGNEQLTAVRSKAVAVECLERAFACGSGIKQHFHGFSRFEGVLDDLCPVRIHLRIMFPVSRDGDNAGNILRSELARYDFFQIERLATLGETCQRTEAEEKCDAYLFHIYLLCLSVSLFFLGNKYTTKGRFIEAVGRFYSF